MSAQTCVLSHSPENTTGLCVRVGEGSDWTSGVATTVASATAAALGWESPTGTGTGLAATTGGPVAEPLPTTVGPARSSPGAIGELGGNAHHLASDCSEVGRP